MLKIIYNETKSNVFIIYAENTKKLLKKHHNPEKNERIAKSIHYIVIVKSISSN